MECKPKTSHTGCREARICMAHEDYQRGCYYFEKGENGNQCEHIEDQSEFAGKGCSNLEAFRLVSVEMARSFIENKAKKLANIYVQSKKVEGKGPIYYATEIVVAEESKESKTKGYFVHSKAGVGYTSWIDRETFESSHRQVTKSELALIVEAIFEVEEDNA